MSATPTPAATCTCGCGVATTVTEAREPCGCGCMCCTPPDSPQEERLRLENLRETIDARLNELQA